MARHETLAAVDLGSNSFHLQIGRVVDGQIYPLDAVREVVRLGGGLTAEKRIDRATQAAALEALAKFGERLRGFPRAAVRAVGTNALRVAKNAPQFLREARATLGFPIDVISGREEARLIYLGVAHALPSSSAKRLVIDVGGGSTEFIIGTGYDPLITESLYMGCVSYSLKYFAEGRIDKARMKAAELAARQEMAAMFRKYRETGWQEAVGSSGTARSIESILRANELAAEGVTREGLERLRSLLIKQERADPERIAGLRANRAPVLPGGVAIMSAVFDTLGLDSIKVSDGALRHGVLYDLLGRARRPSRSSCAATTSMGRKPSACARLRSRSTMRSRRAPSARTMPSARCSNGRRASPRSASPSPRRAITSIRPTCSRMPTCPASRAWSRRASRASCSRIAASSARCRMSGSRRATGSSCSRCASLR
jgi:exopolyphosphatase/guanosine-5'-triphosphate,3'-diphosphate pyrophosphatase